jgi:hypothetical protein
MPLTTGLWCAEANHMSSVAATRARETHNINVILALPDAEHRIAVNNGDTADPPHGHLLPNERALPRNRSAAAAARPRNRSQADPARRFWWI